MSLGSANSRSNVFVGAGFYLVAIENRLTVFVMAGLGLARLLSDRVN